MKIKVERYKGEKALQAGMKKMARKGYVVQTHTSRKKLWSFVAGPFTRQQIHTVTFVLPTEVTQ